METNEIPSPLFIANESGRLSVFLPAFEGEAETPFFEMIDENTLLFHRTSETACFLTNLSKETTDLLKGVEKCLAVELDMEVTLEILNNTDFNLRDSFHRYYEVEVRK